MSESFDPYYTWLGIPPGQQPPTHYRLLGLEALESNPDVIESAADQRMAHLRSFQTGKHSADSQRLLNEVAAAKICLLDPKRKVEYDDALRQQQAIEKGDAVAADVFASADPRATASSSKSSTSAARSKPNMAIVGGSAAAVVLVVLIAAWVFLSGGTTSDEPRSVAKTDAAPKQAPVDKQPSSAPPATDPKKTEAPGNVGQAASLPVAENAPNKSEDPSPPKVDSPPAASPPATSPAPAPPSAASDPSPKPAEEVKKHPIPSADSQREIGAAVEETYKTSQAKTPEAKVQLAKELSVAAGKSAKRDEQYVLMRKAADLACNGGDAALMLEMLGPMSDAFAIDPLVAKAAMLERFAKGPRSPARVQSLADASRGVIDDALADDRYEIASNLARTVADACSRSSAQVRKEAADRRKRVGQIQKQFEEVQKALETLKARPEDAEANLAAGTWYAFVKDDWKTGLAHLVKGSDPLLKSLANRELSSPLSTPEDQLKLADAWWDAAADRRGEQQAAMLRTAGHWYEQSLGQLDGINKTKAEKRLSQLAELARDTPTRPGREPPPAIAPFDAKRARAYQVQWARYLKVPVEFTNAAGIRFVLIPPGEFDMGCTQEEVTKRLKAGKDGDVPSWMAQRISSEAPQHRVKITQAFYLSACEVTNAEYAHVMGTNPSFWKNADYPVEQVSWDDAVTYCRRLSDLRGEKFGAGEYRLPTEAEWEYAARAGTTTAFCSGDDPATLSDFAWTRENSGMTAHAVGQKKPNSFGLYDVYGNVWEWCADGFSVDFYKQSPAADPFLLPTEKIRILRGGGWGSTPTTVYFRSTYRHYDNGDLRGHETGFRVARSISAQASPKKSKPPALAAVTDLPDSTRKPSPSTADRPAESSAESAARNPKYRGEKTKPQPGTVLAEDQHEGWCGNEPRNNTYALKAVGAEPLSRTCIRFKAGPVRESNGRILLSLDGDTFEPFAVWTTATCLESLKTSEGWQTVFFPPTVDKLRLQQIRIMFQHQSGPDGLAVQHVIWMKK